MTARRRDSESMFPKEHGAYGQVILPLVTSFAVAGISGAGLLFAIVVIAGFLAHEPALVMLGLRGPRARRESGPAATRWLIACACLSAVGLAGAAILISAAARWSIAVPLLPALVLAIATVSGREKTWYGEVAASVAFAGVAVPLTMAAGAPLERALSVAIPFALLFVASTLAVRVVILEVRRGGDRRAATATRRAALVLAAGGVIALAGAALRDVLPGSVLAASTPGLATAATVAARPPSPTHLRTLGWALVAVSIVTAAIVMVTG